MKKALAIAFALALLISAILGTMLINLTFAQHQPPPITVTIDSTVIQSNNVTVAFTVKAPSNGLIDRVCYTLDGEKSINITLNDWLVFQHSINLTGLSAGKHILVIEAWGTSYYFVQEPYPAPIGFYTKHSSNVSAVGVARFVIEGFPPIITILSVQNRTYDTSDIPLNFTVNEQLSVVSYSLDGQANVTITGNTTLNKLSDGLHSIVIYGKNTAGNMGASETVYFTIAQQSEPFLTTLFAAVTAIVAIGATVTLGVAVYRRKRLAFSKKQ